MKTSKVCFCAFSKARTWRRFLLLFSIKMREAFYHFCLVGMYVCGYVHSIEKLNRVSKILLFHRLLRIHSRYLGCEKSHS